MTHQKRKFSNPEIWELELIKKQRYAKGFIPVTECCTSECWKTLDEEAQLSLFDAFEQSYTKEVQDIFLSTCMQQKSANRINVENSRRTNTWTYYLRYQDIIEVRVCQKFIRKLYQITEKRIRIIQKKILDGKSFAEKRGSHNKHANKFPQRVFTLLEEHLKLFPANQSHEEEIDVEYFKEQALSVKQLHELFKVYYKEKTNEDLEMKYNTYLQYYYKATQ